MNFLYLHGMKTLRAFIFIALSLFVYACGETEPSFQEKLETSIAEYYKIDSAQNVVLKDTIFVADLDSVDIGNQDAREIINTSLDSTPVRIERAEANIAKAKENLENVKFDMLKPIWEEMISEWEEILAEEQENLKEAQRMDKEIIEQRKFIDLARTKIDGNKAYYLSTANVKGEDKILAISTKFTVFYEFPPRD